MRLPRSPIRVRSSALTAELIEQRVELRARRDELPVRRRRDAESRRDREARLRHLAQVRALAADERRLRCVRFREGKNIGIHLPSVLLRGRVLSSRPKAYQPTQSVRRRCCRE